MDIKEYISSGIIEAYVMGLASEEEVSILECVRKNNAEVEQAILEAQQTLEDFATVHAMPPPSGLKTAIWDKISAQESTDSDNENIVPFISQAEENKLSVEQKSEDDPKIKNLDNVQPSRTMSRIAVAASLISVCSLLGNLYLHNKSKENESQLAKVAAENNVTQQALANLQDKWKMIHDPQMKTITLAGVENHPGLKALVFWDSNSKNVYLSMENMPAAPEGMQYQLWAIVDGKPVDAGVFPQDKTLDVNMMSTIPSAQAFAITLEKQGGSPTPTMSQMYVMGNI
ncbi:anti-sigma factor [Sphingobacterium spiritivorum]|uniref:anti-sigma factor n=1 Tax=Sphingobacterium spiritivorum TaxID=258 RepID=UPI003DA4766E